MSRWLAAFRASSPSDADALSEMPKTPKMPKLLPAPSGDGAFPADAVQDADSCTSGRAASAGGARGAAGSAAPLAAFLARASVDAAEALAEPDDVLLGERMALLRAPLTPSHERTIETHANELAGLLRSALSRPPCWADQDVVPSRGAECACCRGRRWWSPWNPMRDGTGLAPGWRCATCRPALDALAVAEVVT